MAHLDEDLVESMCQTLRIPLPDLQVSGTDRTAGRHQRSVRADLSQLALLRETSPVVRVSLVSSHSRLGGDDDL